MSACKQHRSEGQSPMNQQEVKKNVQKRWTRTDKECKNKEKRDLTRVTVSPKQYFPAVLIRICSSAASMHPLCKDNWVYKGLNIVYATTESVLLLEFYGNNVSYIPFKPCLPLETLCSVLDIITHMTTFLEMQISVRYGWWEFSTRKTLPINVLYPLQLLFFAKLCLYCSLQYKCTGWHHWMFLM